MDDFESSFDVTMDDSDAFSPEKPKKAPAKKPSTGTTKKISTSTAASKKVNAPKADKPKAPTKPRAKKAQIPVVLDEDMSMDLDRSFDVLETPQLSSDAPSPPRPAVLQESNAPGQKKNASETYQKVDDRMTTTDDSLRNLNTFLFDLIPYVFVCVDSNLQYIGSTEAQTQSMWVYDSDKEMMVYR